MILGLPILWTSREAAAAVGGRLSGEESWAAQGVSIDTRSLQHGDLFVALAGARDGHDFVADALDKGAAAALVSRRPEGLPASAPLLVVEDTLQGLTDLGRMGRLRSRAAVIGVTGSVGKTTSKELLRLALAEDGETYASEASYNNHWGVPLSLSRLPRGAKYGVFEMGMNRPGEIAALSDLVKPGIAIITAIAPTHIEFFPSEGEIADAKAEIFRGMGPDGTAILPRDSEHYARLLAHARTQGIGTILSFGGHKEADARLVEMKPLPAGGSLCRAALHGEIVEFQLKLSGAHIAGNALAVLLAAKAAGAAPGIAARGMAKLLPLKGRGARRTIRLASGGTAVLIDEGYNASPASMRAALAVLGAEKPRRVAVLGDMLELGERGPGFHAALAEAAEAAGIETVFTCGPLMKNLHDSLPARMRGAHAPDSAALAPVLAEAVRAGDTVMVKGSLGSRMAVIVEALGALDCPGQKCGGG
jgi:UDP-N-acetylmuramoyl-tripeptide--D-alanyl-D-alanine ligase